MWRELNYKHHDNLHAIYIYKLHNITKLTVGKKNVLYWFLKTDLLMGTLATFTHCIVTSEITETVDADTKIGLLIFTEIKKGRTNNSNDSTRYRYRNFMSM